MTPQDLRALRQRLGLSQAAAAHLCGVSKRAVTSWEQPPEHDGARTIPEPVARLLRLADTFPHVRAYLTSLPVQ